MFSCSCIKKLFSLEIERECHKALCMCCLPCTIPLNPFQFPAGKGQQHHDHTHTKQQTTSTTTTTIKKKVEEAQVCKSLSTSHYCLQELPIHIRSRTLVASFPARLVCPRRNCFCLQQFGWRFLKGQSSCDRAIPRILTESQG